MRRPIALAILGAALLLRVMIPTGWMPVSGPEGLRIMLCTPAAMAQAVPKTHAMGHGPDQPHAMGHGAAPPQPHHDEQQKPGADQPCAFAGLAMAGDLPLASLAPLPPGVTPSASRPLRREGAVGHGLAAPPPPSTGPPAFA